MNVKRSARMAPHIVGTTRVSTKALPIQGMTLMTFLGRGSNIRPFYGAAPNFQRYEFSAKHHTRNVLDSDVATMLAMKENGRPLFVVAKPIKPQVKVVAKAEPMPEIEAVAPEKTAETSVEKPKKTRKKKAQ